MDQNFAYNDFSGPSEYIQSGGEGGGDSQWTQQFNARGPPDRENNGLSASFGYSDFMGPPQGPYPQHQGTYNSMVNSNSTDFYASQAGYAEPERQDRMWNIVSILCDYL